MHQSRRVPPLPDRQRRKLQAALEQYAPLHTTYRIPYGVPLSVRETFPNGRMLLSCGRSRVQSTFDTPSGTIRRSEPSEFRSSVWSNGTSASSNRPLSGFWSSNVSTQSSNDSSTSLPLSLDLPPPALPQYPGTAKIAGDLKASSSTSSLHTPPRSPTTPNRPSTANKTTLPVRRQDSAHRKEIRRSDPPRSRIDSPSDSSSQSTSSDSKSDDNREVRLNSIVFLYRYMILIAGKIKAKRRLSAFMLRPRAVLQQSESIESQGKKDGITATRMSVSSYGYSQEYARHQSQMSRRFKHIEGHIMIQVLPHELASLQGYRCLCGKHVADEISEESRPRQPSFMHCQGDRRTSGHSRSRY